MLHSVFTPRSNECMHIGYWYCVPVYIFHLVILQYIQLTVLLHKTIGRLLGLRFAN
jgi:meiotically up-regulated gene 157 (Mug157) protein